MTDGSTASRRGVFARAFPEKCLFIRSDDSTRYLRLSPLTQILGLAGGALIVGWSLVASAFMLSDTIGAGSVRAQTEREQSLYEERLNALSGQRDEALASASEAHDRFTAALAEVSAMQSQLLASETRLAELERGVEIAQAGLRRTLAERDEARAETARLTAEIEGGPGAETDLARLGEMESTLGLLSAALDSTATQRDAIARDADAAEALADEMLLEARLSQDRNERIFAKIEDALSISVAPLDRMFENAGLDTDELIDTVRRGHTGQGGPITPITFSTKGEAPDADSLRANSILERLDRMNLYRIAAQKTPFAIPVKSAFRFTSGFGPRWGRMHNGTDFAAALGTPIYATADGVVTYAGWMSGFGNLVKIQHEFGIETFYAHQSKIRVQVGQRVSRGERIGDMGTTGRSTGVHLHYEVRVGGTPVNPMTYIEAARDVF